MPLFISGIYSLKYISLKCVLVTFFFSELFFLSFALDGFFLSCMVFFMIVSCIDTLRTNTIELMCGIFFASLCACSVY